MHLAKLRAIVWATLAVVCGSVAFLTACVGDAPPTPTPPSAEGLRASTIGLLRGITSVEFAVTHPNVPTDMGGGLFLNTVEGAAAFPDRAEMAATGSVQRVAVEFGIVQIGSTTYFRGPIGDTWRTVDPSTLPFNFNGMNTSVADALSDATGISLEAGDPIDGQATYILAGRIVSDDLRGLVPGAASGLPIDLKAWIRRTDGMPLRVVLDGSVIAADTEDMVRQLDLGGFNKAVTIEPPI